MKEQNYSKVADYTKRAFQLCAKRALAEKIINVLARPKHKKEILNDTQSDPGIDDSISNDIPIERKNLGEELEGKNNNFRFTRQMLSQIRESNATTRIGKVCYGDYIGFQLRGLQTCRVTVIMDSVKIFTSRDLPNSSFNSNRMCFEVCCPSSDFNWKGEPVTPDSMVCLKSVFTGSFLQLSSNVIDAYQLGFRITLTDRQTKETVFRMVSKKSQGNQISTDHQVCLVSFYNPELYWSIEESTLQKLIDRILIASYQPTWFRISLSQSSQKKPYPFFYIKCPEIHKFARAEFIPFGNQVIRKEFNKLELEEGEQKQIHNYSEIFNFYELGDTRQGKNVLLSNSEPLTLYHIWEIDRSHVSQGSQCKITNLITGQSLAPDFKQANTSLGFAKRASMFQLKQEQSHRNHYSILNDDSQSLCAVYQGQGEQYTLKFQQDTSLKNSGVGKTCIVQFEFIEIDSSRSQCLVQLLECFQLLKNNYPFFEKWGFSYVQHEFKLTYSITLFKNKLLMMRRKVNELMVMLQKLKMILQHSDYTFEVKDLARQAKILEILILYCKIINIKTDSHKYRDKQIFQLATAELKPLNDKLLAVISLMVEDNKGNSEVIIQHSIFFNHMLSLLPDTIGSLLEESIKNLCQLTKKISKQELVLFEWTRLVDFITSTNKINIQRKYIDIIAEVVIDPNDIGITPYQNKIKEQLFTKTKKKIFPKYLNCQEKGPMVRFEYVDFPIDIETIRGQSGKCFQLRQLFIQRKFKPEYEIHIDYLSSLLKLLRNLCKDRNRKMPKVVQDYGLTQHYMHSVFRDTSIGWSLIARFLDLYCSMYLIQDPLVSFEKREVKCFAWWKIQEIDFNKKTAIVFNQFTEEHIAQDKLKQFDLHILPLLDAYFTQLSMSLSTETCISTNFDIKRFNSFEVFVSVMYEIINYGYLNQRRIYKYLVILLKKAEFVFFKECCIQKRRKLVQKIVQLCTLAEEISTIIAGMNLIKTIYYRFQHPFQPNRQKIIDTFAQSLNFKCKAHQQQQAFGITRKMSMKTTRNKMKKNSHEKPYTVHEHPFEKDEGENFDIINFTLNLIIDSKNRSSQCKIQSGKLLGLLDLISKRGERLSAFLADALIFTNPEEETLYLEYSGITPVGLLGDSSSSSRRLLNVTKVKELVDRITEQSLDSGEQDRKKQKIYELNNLLSKILSNLEQLKNRNYQLFGFCQLLLQKLKMHLILAQVLRFHEYESYQEVIEHIIRFYCQFVEGNPQNLKVMAYFFPQLTKRYSYKCLPNLLSWLFGHVQSQQQSFQMLFSNVGKKMKQSHKQILFSCIYKILKVCPSTLFLKIKGQVIYALTSLQRFGSYIKGEVISICFINLLCFVGGGITGVHQKIKQHIRKAELLSGLQSEKTSYELKWVYLRLYYLLYVQYQHKIDELEVTLIIENIFLHELMYLPAACRVGALSTINQTEGDASKLDISHKLKEKMQQQFDSLVTNFHEALTASQEESYFNYLLNNQEESQFSMLVFFEKFISKFNVHCIDALVGYVFKLITFMDRIHYKQTTYQSRILRKLYDICQIFDERYNRTREVKSKLQYNQAYEIVQKFYRRVVGIIQKQNITYAQILRCAGVNNSDLAMARSSSEGSKLVPLSYFLKFVNDLLQLVNNRQQCLQISDTTIKQFFNQFKQENSSKLNLLSFLGKLTDMLEYQKNQRLIRQINQNQRSESSLSLNIEQSQSLINRTAIRTQILNYIETYHMLLTSTMKDRIQEQLVPLLTKRKQFECNNGCRPLFDLHTAGESFRVTELVVMLIIQDMSNQECSNRISTKDIENYLKFCLQQAQKELTSTLITVIQHLYNKVKGNQAINLLFTKYIRQINLLICSAVLSSKIYNHLSVLEHYYSLVGTMSRDKIFSREVESQISTQTSKLLIKCFDNLFQTANTYWRQCCNLLCDALLHNFDEFHSIGATLSSFNQFKAQIIEFLRQYLPKNSLSISKFCKECSIFNKICLLIIKFRAKGLKAEIAKIVDEWPFDELFDFVCQKYCQIVAEKGLLTQKCQRQQGCSFQFCNNGKLTPSDSEKADTLINILTVIFIAAELVNQCQLQSSKCIVISHYTNWMKGSTEHIPQKYLKMFGTVHRISINTTETSPFVSTIYFSLPFLDKFQKVQFEEASSQEMKVFKKDNYLENIYKFSHLVEKKLQNLEITQNDVLAKNYKKIYDILQIIFVAYLITACIAFIRYDMSLSGVLHALNTVLLIFKAGLFWWDLKEFISERRVLLGIEYQEYTIFWKYTRILNSCVLLVCYLMLYFWMQLYPVALILELYNVKYCQDIVNYFLKSMQTILSLVIPSQIMLLGCSFYIVNYKGYQDTIYNVFIQINYETMKLDSVTLIVDDPDSYPLLKLIPYTIPLFAILYLLFKTLFISCVVYEIIKKQPSHKQQGDICMICNASRMNFEEKGLNFSNHIEREHSIWSYIYFFIYLRRHKDDYLVDRSLAHTIENGELQLLKLGVNSG